MTTIHTQMVSNKFSLGLLERVLRLILFAVIFVSVLATPVTAQQKTSALSNLASSAAVITKNLSINNTHRFDLSPTDNSTGQVD